jgi:hypothetical protein
MLLAMTNKIVGTPRSISLKFLSGMVLLGRNQGEDLAVLLIGWSLVAIAQFHVSIKALVSPA